MKIKTCLLIVLGGIIFFSCESNNALDGDSIFTIPEIAAIERDQDNFILIHLDRSYTGEINIILERSTNGDFEIIPHEELSRTALRDTSFDREANHGFTYRIQLQSGELFSEYSEARSYQFITVALIPPDTVQVLTLELQGIRLDWRDRSGNEERYFLEKDVGTGFQPLATLAANAGSYFDAIPDMVDPPLNLKYRLQAHNDMFSSPWVEIETSYSGLGNPTNLRIADTSFHSFILEWDDNSSIETGYSVERLTDNGQYEEIAELPADVNQHLEFQTATGLHRYRVRAKQGDIYSAYSNEMIYFITHELPTEDLVAYWPFDGNADDMAGDNHGIVAGATLVQDRFGVAQNAFSFDGDDWITIEDSPTLTLGSGPFTLAAWINLSSYGDEGGYYLLSHSEGAGNATKWFFWLANDGIRFVSHPAPGGIPLGAATFNLNQWYHVAIRRSGLELRAYVDGELIGINGLFVSVPDPGGIFQIGTESDRPNGVYKGVMDDVRFYKRALSRRQIQTLYHEGGWGN